EALIGAARLIGRVTPRTCTLRRVVAAVISEARGRTKALIGAGRGVGLHAVRAGGLWALRALCSAVGIATWGTAKHQRRAIGHTPTTVQTGDRCWPGWSLYGRPPALLRGFCRPWRGRRRPTPVGPAARGGTEHAIGPIGIVFDGRFA